MSGLKILTIFQLEGCHTTEEKVAIRSNLMKKRNKYILFFSALFCIPIIVFVCFPFNMLSWVTLIIGLIIVAVLYVSISKYSGNISTQTKTDFLFENSDFSLYLRAFEKDLYYPNCFSTSKNTFSEYHFTKILSKWFLCAAIGMTEEIDAPIGAIRVYVNDETWKEDVKELMNKANLIFILISSRPSCIWEIESTNDLLSKTIFIIDDPVDYVLVQEAVKNKVKLPDIPNLTTSNYCYFLIFNGEKFVYYNYENTKKGYKNMISTIFGTVFN